MVFFHIFMYDIFKILNILNSLFDVYEEIYKKTLLILNSLFFLIFICYFFYLCSSNFFEK